MAICNYLLFPFCHSFHEFPPRALSRAGPPTGAPSETRHDGHGPYQKGTDHMEMFFLSLINSFSDLTFFFLPHFELLRVCECISLYTMCFHG